MALARLSLLKSAPLLNDSSVTHNDGYKLALKQATADAGRYCGRELEETLYIDQRHRGLGALRLYPREWPVSDLVAVEIWDGSAWTAEDSANYELLDERFIEFPKIGRESDASYSCWPASGRDNVQLTYSAGYDTTGWDSLTTAQAFGVPADLELAVAQIAADTWRSGGGRQASSESFGPRAVSYLTRNGVTIPERAAAILDSYVRVEL